MEQFGQRRLTVCTVCGPYRTGKSYLLNLLLGRLQRGGKNFRVGSTSQACTEGLWMWAAKHPGIGGNDLLFIDCEGFGSTESDKVRDAKLLSLCLLISSVFVLNTKGVLNEGLFNALSLVCGLAEHIEDQSGGDAGKPALVWLLRDFLLELRDDENGPLSPDEYLERALRTKPLAGAGAERTRAAKEVRENLLRFFPQRHCATLVQPVIDEDRLRELQEVPYHDLRPEFRTAFEAVQAKLVAIARAKPKVVGGQLLGGAALVALLRRLVQAVNTNAVLNVGNAWEQVQHSGCEALARELRDTTGSTLRRWRDGEALPHTGGHPLPVGDDVLAKALKESRQMLRREWRARAFGDEDVRSEYWRELRSGIAEDEQALEELNARKAEEELRRVGAEWEAWLMQDGEAAASDPRSEALALALGQGLPARPTSRAAREALHLARMARLKWDGTVDALKAELRLASGELAARTAVAQDVGRFNDVALEHTRELGQLQGQVDVLQNQAREAIQAERSLKEQVLKADAAMRNEKQAYEEVARKCKDLEETIRKLEEQVADFRRMERARRERPAEQEDFASTEHRRKPKCGCTVM